jgi:hypothetical protein
MKSSKKANAAKKPTVQGLKKSTDPSVLAQEIVGALEATLERFRRDSKRAK